MAMRLLAVVGGLWLPLTACGLAGSEGESTAPAITAMPVAATDAAGVDYPPPGEARAPVPVPPAPLPNELPSPFDEPPAPPPSPGAGGATEL